MKLAGISECTGCGACASVCAKGCINMKIGKNGFFLPHVSIENCVECGLCSKNCHILNKPIKQPFDRVYFCGWDKSEKGRFEGSSGGAFGAFSDVIIRQGGIVYGASFSSDKKTLSHKSTSEVTLAELKKSKYLESDMGVTISRIHKDLKDGKEVLFCGTPCQVYGVRRVFGYKYSNLLLCDFICHGIPSQSRYRQYIKELEIKYNSPVKDIGFRTKRYGWKTYCMVVDFENGKQYVKLANEDPYFKHFFSNTNIRPSCYSCNRAAESVADITLGDFWGAQKSGIADNDKGISIVICNTEKGKKFAEGLNSFYLKLIDASDVAYAFKERHYVEASTPLDQSFFEGFKVNLKDRLASIVLKNYTLRKIFYWLR